MESSLGVKEKTIKMAFGVAMKAHRNPEKPFVIRRKSCSSSVVFGFHSTWSAAEFGQTKLDLALFPSLRSIGNDEAASLNDAFLRRFFLLTDKPVLREEVEKALKKKKRIIFAGHSGGGPVSICATVWLFEYLRSKKIRAPSPFCITFGSPLIADHIFGHALRRERWSDHFIHFITRYDIVPRIMLAPPSSTEHILPKILAYFDKNSQSCTPFSEKDEYVEAAFETVLRNASNVASQAACHMMGSTNHLVDTLSSFVELSPYRPFGTYVFCYGNRKLLTAKNPDAVLQLLIYSSQLNSLEELPDVARMSLTEHLSYKLKLDEITGHQDLHCLDKFQELPLNSEECATGSEIQTINTALDDLGLSVRARLCLRAAREAENRKIANQKKMDDKLENMKSHMAGLEKYRTSCEARGTGYYDSFKSQKHQEDFDANIKRLELAGVWDEIIELLKKHELPDGFEGDKSRVELGTRYRRLVEPLDIANYYRNALNADTQKYFKPGSRPKRYWYTQRWREHEEQMARGSSSSGESTFWAEVEELRIATMAKKTPYEAVRNKIMELEKNLKAWFEEGLVKKDAFLPKTTLVSWWETLPEQHRAQSAIKGLISSGNRNI